MRNAGKKLVYILPEYRDDIATHMYYNAEFLARAQKELDIFLVLEKGAKPRYVGKSRVLFFRFFPFRACELFITFLALRIRGYKTFWTHYSFLGGVLAPIFGRSFYWNCGMPWLYERGALEEYFFRLALKRSFLVTGTDGMKALYGGKYGLDPKKIYVMPNWIEARRYGQWLGRKKEARCALGIPQEKKVVLFLHRVSKRKGADMIMPVAKKFTGDSGVLFLVAGAGPLEGSIRGANIKTLGAVPQNDVPKYMAASDIFFMPSEEEGFPHVLLEAMVLGVPIVASRVGGVSEITPAALEKYVTARDAQKFYENIRLLLNNRELAQALGDEERKHAEKYDIEKVLPLFIKILNGYGKF